MKLRSSKRIERELEQVLSACRESSACRGRQSQLSEVKGVLCQLKQRITLIWLHSRLSAGLILAMLLVAGLSCGCEIGSGSRFQGRNRLPGFEPMQESEDLQSRSDWFLFQRTYPFGSLPAEARRKAWELSRRASAEALAVPLLAQRWQAIGPSPTISAFFSNWGLTSGRVNTIAISPANPQLLLIGGATGGIWRSTDGGASFTPVADDQVDLAVGSIAFSKTRPSIVYAGMGDSKLGYLGSGVLKSTDGGRSWTRVSNATLPAPGTIAKLEVDPIDPNRVYVAQASQLAAGQRYFSGFYVSTDGGINWAKKMSGLARDLAIDAQNPKKLYLGISRTEGDSLPAGLYVSTDGGESWKNSLALPFDAGKTRDVKLAVTPADPQRVYVYTGGFLGENFYVYLLVSSDAGITWVNRGSSGFDTAQFGYNSYVVADPTNADTVYIGSRDLYRSNDGGASWINLTGNFAAGGESYEYTPDRSNTHPDQHALVFSPDNPNVFYIANDGGISKTSDGGRSFSSLNATLSLTQFISITLHPSNQSISYGGTQDNGTQRKQAGRWVEFSPGDGGQCLINPLDPSMIFAAYTYGSIARYTNNGDRFDYQITNNQTFGEPEEHPRIAFYPPLTGNGFDPTLYFGTWRLFISTDLGLTWSAPAGTLDLTKGITDHGADVLTAISVARSDRNVIYTGSAQGRAMVSTDGGKSWSDISAGLPNRFISSICADESNAATVYLTVSGFGSGHVFKSTDRGATWKDISSTLPDIPVNALLIDPISPIVLYAGTDIGVFRSTDGGINWRLFNDGLPPVIVHAFAALPTGLIQVATYGRGAYELEVEAASSPKITSASFDGYKNLSIEGSGFGDSPRVLINGSDRSDFITGSSTTAITLKGKPKKLGLRSGENTLQVISPTGATSNVFVLRL
jgi:photosystem II stability/assembly factor-like uncharacterized protein